MNKTKFVEDLIEKLGKDLEYSWKVADLLEDNFLIGKNNKKKTIANLVNNLGVSESDANEIYNTASSIIATEIKNKLKHPFKSLD